MEQEEAQRKQRANGYNMGIKTQDSFMHVQIKGRTQIESV
jgi:hypothetical protein